MSKQSWVKKNSIHLIAVVVFLLIGVLNFYPVFEGKKLNYTDSNVGMSNEVKQFEKETGEVARWTNAMFGGMPTYYIYAKLPKDIVDYMREALRLFSVNEFGNFFAGMVLFYLLMMVFKVDPRLSIFASIAFAFTTNNLVLLDTGHLTKLNVILYSPLIIAGLILAFREKLILGTLVFAMGMSMSIKGDHPQMTYYLGLSLIPLVIVYFYKAIKEKKLPTFAKTCAALVLGLILSFGTTASKVLPVKEYSDDTMRGKPILKNTSDAFSSSGVDGLSWDYAMNWSNGPIDLLQSFIPFSVGGSTAQPVGKDSNFAKAVRQRRDVQAPLYWGDLPSTSGPIYFGAIVFMLFIISIFTLKDKLKWWLLSGTLLTLLLSLGSNFEILSRFFFDYVPLYNKFRTPNSVLSITILPIALAAFYGLNQIIENKVDFKKVLYPGLALAGFCVLYGFLAPSMCDMTGAYDSRYAQMGLDSDVLMKDRSELVFSSSIKSGILMLLTLGLLWGYYKNKLSKLMLILGIGFLTIFDLFSTNMVYVTPAKYKSDRNLKASLQPRPVDKQILQDNDPNYRVLDLTIPTFESAASSYHHKTVGGYHAAKLTRYNDMIDRHLRRNNMDVLNMLNTKYIISQAEQGGTPQVQRNTAALGNAWFINDVRIVDTNEEEIDAMNDFDPLGTAIIHKEFESYLESKTFDKTGQIQLTEYKPNMVSYTSNANSDQLAVFSEIWYGPNKGWQAYIDDKAVDHIRANYILRALKIPGGNHKITFKFDPQSVSKGGLISKIFSFIITGLLLFYLANYLRPEEKKWFNWQ